MSVPFHFLLISDPQGDRGHQVFREALVALGSLQVASEGEMASLLREPIYDAVIVDAGAVTSAPDVVSQIRRMDPAAKIVVVTASPHWKVAKAVLRAGATDYLHKSLSKDEIMAGLRAILK